MADEETKPRSKPKDNPWYRLATLHGELTDPGDQTGVTNESVERHRENYDVSTRNMVTWNRWMASHIGADLRTRLIDQNGYTAEMLTPFSEKERCCIEARTGVDRHSFQVDFSDLEVESPFRARYCIFPSGSFKGTTFAKETQFSGSVFLDCANFEAATFLDHVRFDGATFYRSANFMGAKFHEHMSLLHARFPGLSLALFQDVKFLKTANFADMKFAEGSAMFSRSEFSTSVEFSRTEFASAFFENVTFAGSANFHRVSFAEAAVFEWAKFTRHVNFAQAKFRKRGANFVNAVMQGEANFLKTEFEVPPRFFGATLHEGTV